LADVRQIAFVAILLKHFVGGRSGKGLAGPENPDAVFLDQRPDPSGGT